MKVVSEGDLKKLNERARMKGRVKGRNEGSLRTGKEQTKENEDWGEWRSGKERSS